MKKKEKRRFIVGAITRSCSDAAALLRGSVRYGTDHNYIKEYYRSAVDRLAEHLKTFPESLALIFGLVNVDLHVVHLETLPCLISACEVCRAAPAAV